MKFSANMLAGLGLIAATGLITPVSAATTGMSDINGPATQSSMPSGSSQAGRAQPTDNAQASGMSSSANASRNPSANLSQQNIMELQQALNSQGEKVSSDGRWGPGTESALKHFQQKNGLPVTGQLDDATKSKLNLNG
jgi:hypothetical protein